jgi:hypothetical protein
MQRGCIWWMQRGCMGGFFYLLYLGGCMCMCVLVQYMCCLDRWMATTWWMGAMLLPVWQAARQKQPCLHVSDAPPPPPHTHTTHTHTHTPAAWQTDIRHGCDTRAACALGRRWRCYAGWCYCGASQAQSRCARGQCGRQQRRRSGARSRCACGGECWMSTHAP